jgi:glycosyltransferase involved in cell wall biosynthesis
MSWALLRYDIFHLFCDRGLLPPSRRMEINPRELELYSRAGKFLFTYAYGADVRTREATLALGAYNLCKDCPQPGLYCQCSTEEGESNTSTIKKYATAMVAMGDMLAYIPQPRNMHYWPLDLQRFRNIGVDWAPGKPLRVGHVPNHAHFKGTEYLIAAIDRLLAEGWPIELLSAQGVPNEKVLEIYASADIVADQFIAGFHGYAALEAMALGKPVLCFLRNEGVVPAGASCPIIDADPDSLYAVLLRILKGEVNLPEIGQLSRAYVERYCSIPAVAGRLASMYLDLLPLNEKAREALQGFGAGS